MSFGFQFVDHEGKNLYLSPLPLVVLQAWQLPPCLRIGQLMDCLFGTGTHMGSPVRCGTNPGLELLPGSTGNSGACSQQTSNPTCSVQHAALCAAHTSYSYTSASQVLTCSTQKRWGSCWVHKSWDAANHRASIQAWTPARCAEAHLQCSAPVPIALQELGGPNNTVTF